MGLPGQSGTPAAPCHEVPSYTSPGGWPQSPLPRKMQGTDPRQLRTPARVLTVLGQPVLAEVVRLALSHGQFQTRIAADEAEATAMLGEWQPHMAIIDMDVSTGELLAPLSAAPTPVGRLPVVA